VKDPAWLRSPESVGFEDVLKALARVLPRRARSGGDARIQLAPYGITGPRRAGFAVDGSVRKHGEIPSQWTATCDEVDPQTRAELSEPAKNFVRNVDGIHSINFVSKQTGMHCSAALSTH
jgi:hypothetical protein